MGVQMYVDHLLHYQIYLSLVPRPDLPEKEGPGIYCSRMRVII